MDHFVGGDAGQTWYAVFNPNSNSVGQLQTVNLSHDMFCPGIAMQADGDIMVVGGSAGGDGAGSSSTWTGTSFSASPKLNIPRGYNSALTLANGNVCFFFFFFCMHWQLMLLLLLQPLGPGYRV